MLPPTLAEAIRSVDSRLGVQQPTVGELRCPVKILSRPAYPIWSQVHQNRLAGLLLRPRVLASLDMICVLAAALDEAGATSANASVRRRQLLRRLAADKLLEYSHRPVMDALLTGGPCVTSKARSCAFALPLVLSHLRRASPGLKLVLYHNPRGSSPSGSDSCMSSAEVERLAVSTDDGGPLLWHSAGTLVRGVNASGETLLVRPPYDFAERKPRGDCAIVASFRSTHGQRVNHWHASPASSGCHGVGGAAHERRQWQYRSIARLGDEPVEVLSVSREPETVGGSLALCRLQVRRLAGGAMGEAAGGATGEAATSARRPHDAGTRVLAPVLLDAGARAASCRKPLQYAFDLSHPLATACVATYLERDAAIGADGSWLDNMGANIYGARSPHGTELRSFHLEWQGAGGSAASAPCVAEREHARAGSASYATLLAFKDCSFSAVARQQAARLTRAVEALRARLGRKPLVYGNGLKHSFYWSAAEMAAVREELRVFEEAGGVGNGGGVGGGGVGSGGVGSGGGTTAAMPAHATRRSELPPFAPDPAERVVYFAVEGTAPMMQPAHALDGLNMESFFGFIESHSEHTCNRWPTVANTTLDSCAERQLDPRVQWPHVLALIVACASRRAAATPCCGVSPCVSHHIHPRLPPLHRRLHLPLPGGPLLARQREAHCSRGATPPVGSCQGGAGWLEDICAGAAPTRQVAPLGARGVHELLAGCRAARPPSHPADDCSRDSSVRQACRRARCPVAAPRALRRPRLAAHHREPPRALSCPRPQHVCAPLRARHCALQSREQPRCHTPWRKVCRPMVGRWLPPRPHVQCTGPVGRTAGHPERRARSTGTVCSREARALSMATRRFRSRTKLYSMIA